MRNGLETDLRKIIIGLLFAAVPVTAASAQDVQRFLVRVDHMLAIGPFALLSPDFYRLKALVEANGEELKLEYAQKKARHEQTLFCPPTADKPRVGKTEYLAALRSVPLNRRPTTDTRDVLRSLLEKKYPCGRAA